MTEMAHGVQPSLQTEPILPQWWHSVDRWSLGAIITLFGIGLLLLLAASPPLANRHGLEPFHYVNRQVAYGALSLIFLVVISILPDEKVRRFGIICMGLALLALMFLPFFGTDLNKGAVRWYSLGFISFQPSEFLKPGFVIFSAWLIASSLGENRRTGIVVSFLFALAAFGLLVIQPDFGQGMLILSIWAIIYFVSGASLKPIMLLFSIMVAAGWFAYSNYQYVAARVDQFLSNEIEPNTQIGYAIDAIRSGGLFGVGVGEGIVKWSLPDAHTDFVISVAAEEYGLVLVLAIIALYLFICIRSLVRLARERSLFIRLAGCGLVSLISLQAAINLAVAARLVPAKGMTLPFVSYGGSSLVASGITIGLLLAMTRSRPQGDIADLFAARLSDPRP